MDRWSAQATHYRRELVYSDIQSPLARGLCDANTWVKILWDLNSRTGEVKVSEPESELVHKSRTKSWDRRRGVRARAWTERYELELGW